MNKSITQLNKEYVIEYCFNRVFSQDNDNFTEVESAKKFLKKHKNVRYNISVRGRHQDGRRSIVPSLRTVIQDVKSFNEFIKSDMFKKHIEVWLKNPIWQDIAHPINRNR